MRTTSYNKTYSILTLTKPKSSPNKFCKELKVWRLSCSKVRKHNGLSRFILAKIKIKPTKFKVISQ